MGCSYSSSKIKPNITDPIEVKKKVKMNSSSTKKGN